MFSLNFGIKLENFQDKNMILGKKKIEVAVIEVGDFYTPD